MKKLLIVAAAICFGLYVSGQDLSFGFKFGPGFSNMRGEAISDARDSQNNKINHTMVVPHLGAFVNIGFGMISAQAELNIAQKGYKVKRTHFDGRKDDFKVQFNYLEIPFLAKASFGEDWPVTVFGEIGPFIGLLMSVKVDGDKEYDDIVGGMIVKEKYKESFKGMDFGIAIGAGAVYKIMDNLGVLANLRYNLGIMKIGDMPVPPGVTSDDVNDLKTGVFNIDFGAVYYLGN